MEIKNILCFTLCMFHYLVIIGQTPEKINGKIFSKTGLPLEYVNVHLFHAKDSNLVKSDVSNNKGEFSFPGIKSGDYYIQTQLLSYQNYISAAFTFDQTKTYNHPDIKLDEVSTTLGAVEITHKKAFLERKLDRLVMNVENSIASAGNTALELLDKAPGVLVNQDQAIQILGKQGVVVMIDGRQTNLSGPDLLNYLKTIPGASIARIDIITHPSSKYEAEGNAGIIDIRMKKDKLEGFNGSLTASAGQGVYFKPNVGLNMNYRKKKINLFGGLSYGAPKGLTNFYINRTFFDDQRNPQTIFDQQSFVVQPLTSSVYKIGLDYYIKPKTILGILLNGNFGTNNRSGFTGSNITNNLQQLLYTTETIIDVNDSKTNNTANINFKHEFNDKGKELGFDLDYANYSNTSKQDYRNIYLDPNHQAFDEYKINANQYGDITVKSLKIDYAQSIQKIKVEMGGKASLVNTTNDISFYNIISNQAVYDSSLSSVFDYQENINALYGIVSHELKNIDYQIGLRMEQTNTSGKLLDNSKNFSHSFIHLFPSISLNFKKYKINQFALSYSRRIDRPSFRQLHPFRIFVDPYTYVVGDPSLLPALTHSFDLTHTFKEKIITSFNYSISKNTITDIFQQDDSSKISNQIPANIEDLHAYSISVSFPLTYKKFLQASVDLTGFYNNYESPLATGILHNDSYSWYGRIQNAVPIGTKGWSTEISYFYQSKMAWGQFIIRDLSQFTFGIQKQSKNKLTTYKLAFTDPFIKNRIRVIVDYENQKFHTDRNWDSRVLTCSIAHRFGKTTVAKARQRQSGVEEEKKRMN